MDTTIENAVRNAGVLLVNCTLNLNRLNLLCYLSFVREIQTNHLLLICELMANTSTHGGGFLVVFLGKQINVYCLHCVEELAIHTDQEYRQKRETISNLKSFVLT